MFQKVFLKKYIYINRCSFLSTHSSEDIYILQLFEAQIYSVKNLFQNFEV